jgi:hypothetical protein
LVAAAGNDADELDKDKEPVYRYPALFAEIIPNMMVVSASDWQTKRAGFSNYSPFVAAFAPGDDVHCPKDPERGKENEMESCDGTSFCRSI